MKNRNIVFCADGRDYGEDGCILFTHEADIMAVAVAGEVESGKLTPAKARKLLEPYRDVLPPLFSGEQRMIFDPDRRGWDDPTTFPNADEIQQSPQASQIFWYEADELGIKGVTLVWSQPYPLLAPVGDRALRVLMERFSGSYEIVVKQDIDEFDSMNKSVEWATKLIEEAESTAEIPNNIMPEPYGFSLIYGESEIYLGLEFLEVGYALEQRESRRELRTSECNQLGCSEITMTKWIDEEVIEEFGWYAPIKNGFHPVIDTENETEVVLLLESLGHICTRDDALIREVTWAGRRLSYLM